MKRKTASTLLLNALQNVILGAVYTRNGVIERLTSAKFDAAHAASKIGDYLRTVIGPVVTSGLITSAGSSSLKLNLTAGVAAFGPTIFTDTALTDIQFLPTFRSSGVWSYGTPTDTLPVTNYDDGTNPVALTTGYFTKHVLYKSSGIGSTKFYLLIGQAEYATEDEAIAGPLPIPPQHLLLDTITIAALVVQQGGTAVAEYIDIRPRIRTQFQVVSGGGGGGVSSHGELSGLTDDDHPQYLLTDGTRTVTGDLNMGGNDITNVATVDGIDIVNHGSRHNPNGLDPVATAAAVSLNAASTSTAGSANALSRADHTHQITGFQPLDSDLTALAALSAVGIPVRTGANTWDLRSLIAPAEGITITDPAGTAGSPTFALANDLQALEGLSSTGIAIRTGIDSWTTRSISSTSLALTNPAGIAGDITINLNAVGAAGTYRSVTTDSFGRVTAGTNPTTLAEYGIVNAQPLDSTLTSLALYNTNGFIVQTAPDNFTGRSIAVASTKLSIVNGSGIAGNPTLDVVEANLTLNNLGGTLGIAKGGTNLTALGSANTVLGVNGGGTALEYKPFTLAALADTLISTPAAGNVLTYSGTQWINSTVAASSATGTLSTWTLVSGNLYRSDFAHNLGTNNIVITLYDSSTNTVVTADEITLISTNSVRVQVTGNARTIRIVVVANGNTVNTAPQSSGTVTTAKDSVNVSTAASRLNFTGQAVTVVDSGAGTTTVSFGSRFTFFAAAFDTPVNTDWAVNALAPTVTDPSFGSLSVRQFSNTVEQGVGFLLSVPTSATTVTFRFRGRAQTAPGATANVQPRLYVRAIPNNGAVGAWSTALNLTSIVIPTNAFFQYSNQTVALSSLGMTAGVTYQIELTRNTGVASNLAANFLLAELTVEVS